MRSTLTKVFGQGVSLNYRVMGEEGADDASSAATTRAAAPRPGVSRMIQTPFTQVAPEELDSQLNRRYTFDNFFEGLTNKLARTAGVAVSNDPGKTTFNPLFIYGPSGVGKTHLCHAIGLRIRQMHPEKLIPLVITNALAGKNLPIYGDGKNVRDWLFVKDHCSAARMPSARSTLRTSPLPHRRRNRPI